MHVTKTTVYWGGERPEIVCLCGSTKFVKFYDQEMLRLTLEGKIVLTIGTHNEKLARKYADDFEGKKDMLDELHKRKIDLADRILVLNIGGYIGDSTRSEIEYANSIGKPVEYFEALENRDFIHKLLAF